MRPLPARHFLRSTHVCTSYNMIVYNAFVHAKPRSTTGSHSEEMKGYEMGEGGREGGREGGEEGRGGREEVLWSAVPAAAVTAADPASLRSSLSLGEVRDRREGGREGGRVCSLTLYSENTA